MTATLSAARCEEVVTLRSGFTIVCVAREALPADQTRLYLSTSRAEPGNYMDVPSASIAQVESADAVSLLQSPPTKPLSASPGRELGAILQQSGATHNVNVALLASVIQTESGGNPRALSRRGAQGLMQLMPRTAAQLGVADSLAPESNVDGGSAYLDRLLTRYHENIVLALAAYNAGPGAVDRFHGVPPFRETRLYVAKVLREFNRLVQNGNQPSVAASATLVPKHTGL